MKLDDMVINFKVDLEPFRRELARAERFLKALKGEIARMPYHLKKAGGGYKVVGPSGAKSKKPLPKARAEAQMRALYANEPKARKKKGK